MGLWVTKISVEVGGGGVPMGLMVWKLANINKENICGVPRETMMGWAW